VESQGIRRSLSLSNIKALYTALVSPYKAKEIIREFKPDIVIGTGGYACWPMLKAASMLHVPCMVHESNAVPGMAVKRLEGCVDKILINFEETREHLKHREKVVRVGNPLKNAFSNMEKDAAREKIGIPKDAAYVLSYGGSGGAEFLNETMVSVMEIFAKNKPNVMMEHAAGSRDFASTRDRFVSLGLDKCSQLTLREYIYDMPCRMAAADLVICRAGAMTLSEIAAMKKAAIVIPSPNVTDNHQYKNAKVLSDAGAAVLVEEKELESISIADKVRELAQDPERRRDMEEKISNFVRPDVSKLIYNEIKLLLGR
jgi:UDP-N-acetylglucosamine--N-acetylmuramyl-(pentapeptide) pyrophosphoryl-undecaprenol N-acetylglucosamine transferase